MKQLLIVGSNATIPAGEGQVDLSTLKKGDLAIFNPETNKYLSNIGFDNFAIALGRGGNSPAFVIPEVDITTLSLTFADASQSASGELTGKDGNKYDGYNPAGAKFKASVTVPTTVTTNADYTIVLVKKGVQFNERSNFTVTTFIPKDSTKSAADIATDLAKQLQAMADAGTLNIKASATGAVVTVEGLIKGEQFALRGGDALMGQESAPGDTTEAQPVIFDAAYIKDLASRTAAGKGFEYRYKDGEYIYPGDPEVVEDTTYSLITLRFAVGRASAKQRDERVYQTVHIAVPVAKYNDVKALFEVSQDSEDEGGQ